MGETAEKDYPAPPAVQGGGRPGREPSPDRPPVQPLDTLSAQMLTVGVSAARATCDSVRALGAEARYAQGIGAPVTAFQFNVGRRQMRFGGAAGR